MSTTGIHELVLSTQTSLLNYTLLSDLNKPNASSQTDVLDDDSPPQPLTDPQIILVSFLYSLVVFLSVTGNLATLWVYTKGPRCVRADIRLWLVNLAIADLLMSIFCIPFTSAMTVLDEWIFPKLMCPFVLFIQNLSVTASVYTNMALGIDRYLVVSQPLRSRRWSGRAKYSIPVIWIIGIAFSAVNLDVSKASKRYTDPVTNVTYLECAEAFPNETSKAVYSVTSLLLTYVVPLVCLAAFYTRIAQLMHMRTTMDMLRATLKHSASAKRQSRAKRKIIKMLVVVVCLFAVCWLPLHLFIMLFTFVSLNELMNVELLVAIYFSVHYLAMCSSFINPLIYGFLNSNFRADLKLLLVRTCLCYACCSQRKTQLVSRLNRRTTSTFLPRQETNRSIHSPARKIDKIESPLIEETRVDDRKIQRIGSLLTQSTFDGGNEHNVHNVPDLVSGVK